MSTTLAADPQQLVSEALKKVSAIATLPEVTARIVSTVEDPKSTAAQLHKIISHDPALVARIMKVVNSSFYGLPGQIASIERAIVLLGLNAVKNIAVAASLGQMFRGSRLCEGFTAKDLWKHCIAVGVTARELARQMKLQLADEAFLAGMIHDIGILVALQVAPEQIRAVCEKVRTAGGDFCETERAVIGYDHQHLGSALMEQWKFPRSCQIVAKCHHQPASLGDDGRQLVTLVYVADTLCAQTGQGFNLTALNQQVEAVGLDARLDPALVEHVRGQIPELVNAASGMLS